jgi:hypothetical protein
MIQRPEETELQFSIPPSWIAWIVLLFPLAGVILLLTGWGECVIDKANNRLEINRWRPWGSKQTSMPLEQVSQLEVFASFSQRSGGVRTRGLGHRGRQVAIYSIGFRGNNGEEISLDSSWSSHSRSFLRWV